MVMVVANPITPKSSGSSSFASRICPTSVTTLIASDCSVTHPTPRATAAPTPPVPPPTPVAPSTFTRPGLGSVVAEMPSGGTVFNPVCLLRCLPPLHRRLRLYPMTTSRGRATSDSEPRRPGFACPGSNRGDAQRLALTRLERNDSLTGRSTFLWWQRRGVGGGESDRKWLELRMQPPEPRKTAA